MKAHSLNQIRAAGCASAHTFSPGEVISARVTVRQGREDGFWYELKNPILVRRPTDPSLEVYDRVKLLKPVDRVPYRAGQEISLMLKIESLHSIGRPNPADGSTTVNVKRFNPKPVRVYRDDC